MARRTWYLTTPTNHSSKAVSSRGLHILRELTDRLRGHTGDYGVARYVFGNDRAGRNDGAFTDCHAGQDCRAGAQPGAGSDVYRLPGKAVGATPAWADLVALGKHHDFLAEVD